MFKVVNFRGSSWRAGGLGAVVLLFVGHFACAEGETGPPPPEDATTTRTTVTTVGNGGSGAAPATGGAGGQGGGNLCDQDCSAIATPQCFLSVCNDGTYQGTVGTCVVVPDVDGASCDDEVFCTTQDSCLAGVCTGGPPNDCGMQPDTCQEVTCDEAALACTTQPVADGTACTHDDLCLLGTTCTSGVCSGGTTNDCFFQPVPDDCHVSLCNPLNGICTPVAGNQGDPCTDINDLCTVDKTCNLGVCEGGSPKDCSSLTMGCTVGVCDTTNGACVGMMVGNGQACDDLDGCTVGELCNNGNCGGGTPVTTCSGAQTADGCCPTSCNATNDLDCAICVANWDNATLQGWTVTATCPSMVNWQPDNFRSQAGTHSLYYGNPAVHNFACGSTAHQGTATSKVINLQPGTPNVTFWVWIATEGGTTYDQLGLWVMPNNIKVWDRNNFPQGALGDTGGVFVQQTVDLTAYAGQAIQLQFRFNTTDGVANSEEGVYIDSLTAMGNCP